MISTARVSTEFPESISLWLMFAIEYVFLAGAFLISFTALGCAFVRAQVPLFLLRAFMGVGRCLSFTHSLFIL